MTLGIALAVLGAALKVNQHVLPRLYDYLHGTLSVIAVGAAALVVALVAKRARALAPRSTWARRLTPYRSRALAAGIGSVVVLAANVATLDANQNVRVALLDPRSAVSRTAVLGAELAWPSMGLLRPARARNRVARVSGLPSRRPTRTTGLASARGAHVLLITIDALRADALGVYGATRPVSPRLDALTRERGVLFERAYTQAPHSSYSLSSLHTSEYLHETTLLGQRQPLPTIADTLEAAGYHTAGFYTRGIFHTERERLSAYDDASFGFALHDHTDRDAVQTADTVIGEIDRIVARGEPSSFLWAHFFDVHEPYERTDFGTRPRDRYDSEIRFTDEHVVRLIEHAERVFRRDVVIAISADHGEEFGEHGGFYHGSSLHDEQVRVPLIVFGPGLRARRVAQPVELVDVAPTLLSLVGIEPAESMRGDDLRPLLEGRVPADASPDPVFAAVQHHKMVVRWPYKLIADLNFDTYQLFDLARDPGERRNLYDARRDLGDELTGEVQAWLDRLGRPPGEEGSADPRLVALTRGRLGDRRATEPLATLVVDASAPTEMRVEAARVLAWLQDASAGDVLASALGDANAEVRQEIAIALGMMNDARGREVLHALVRAEDPEVRRRVGAALARLRDTEAVPLLAESLLAPMQTEREDAARYLGILRDGRAVEPLLAILPEQRTRAHVVLSLGQIGDPRAVGPLLELLDWDRYLDVRMRAITALGLIGDRRAVPALLALLPQDNELTTVGEALVRLRAIERGELSGSDVGPRIGRGFERCERVPVEQRSPVAARSRCAIARGRATLPLRLHGAAHHRMIVRGRAAGRSASDPALVWATLRGVRIGPFPLTEAWRAVELPAPAAAVSARGTFECALVVEAAQDGRAPVVELDHVLLAGPPHTLASSGPPTGATLD
ncbi:MAG: sulfatase-like hydrolase/transferase [Deltaproteobacteria bacterium]|nr:sulfatase-like hydrolase/transferase [Deltaproteobacteria bacterium]